VVLPSDPKVLNRNRDTLREIIDGETRAWRLASANYNLAMDFMRQRSADAMLERWHWMARYLGEFDPYDIARWIQHGFVGEQLLMMAETYYGATRNPTQQQMEHDRDERRRRRVEEQGSDDAVAFWEVEDVDIQAKGPGDFPVDGTVVMNQDIHCADQDDHCEGHLRWEKGRIVCGWHHAVAQGVAIDTSNQPDEEGTRG
jgi:hypothetical protein